jgi:hypothetical protein
MVGDDSLQSRPVGPFKVLGGLLVGDDILQSRPVDLFKVLGKVGVINAWCQSVTVFVVLDGGLGG